MTKALVITEKPSVARDITSALKGFEDKGEYYENDAYVVTWAVGHLLELQDPEAIDPKYKRWMLEDLPIIPERFELQPKSGQSDRLRTIKKLYGRDDVSTIVNACDAGREGELIFREIVHYLHSFKRSPEPKPMTRLWLQSMTKDAIRNEMSNLRDGSEFDGLGAAAQCRSEADWLIGINVTRALTRRMKLRTEKTAWSAGRVQTPTLALLVDRELENLTHRPTPFWRVKARFEAADHSYDGVWYDPKFKGHPDDPQKDDWITDAAFLEKVLAEVRKQPGQASEKRKLQRESARPLFDLTSLQREANRRFGYSARRTLQAAQRLYENHKVLTYPRTDSKCLPEDYKDHVDKVVAEFSGSGAYGPFGSYLKRNGLQNKSRIFDNKKVSDHFAIIPTQGVPPKGLSGDDARIYDLVVRRFLAAFYPPAEWIRVERETVVGKHHFRTRNRYLKTLGWYEVMGKDTDEEEEKALPSLRPADELAQDLSQGLSGDQVPERKPGGSVRVRNEEAESEADQTRPPSRYSEARLLSLMENAGKHVDDEEIGDFLKGKGIGTPATRADIIENLVSKQYVRRADRALRATPKGILLIDLLRRIRAERLASPRLTGELEMHLAEVESGRRTRQDFMQEITDYTDEVVGLAKNFQYDELYASDPPLGVCPIATHLKVVERSRFYCSEDNAGKKDTGVGFIIWKEKNGRYVDQVTMKELLENGETPMLDGFLTSRGQSYKGKLRLDDKGQLELVSEDGKVQGGSVIGEIPEDAQPLTKCPFNTACQIFETPTAYQCRCDESCKEKHKKLKSVAVLPKEVCKREMKPEEALMFFDEGKTAEFDDFISRYGRPFKAKLFLKDNGKHGFEFAPRAKKKKKATTDKTKTKAKKTKAKSKKKTKTKAKSKAKAKSKSKAKAKTKKAKKSSTKKT